jgi:16S rRNA (cytosine1402-N4)-methyltransferase
MSDTPRGEEPVQHKRRPRYKGTHPRTFAEKYKEHDPERYKDDVAHVIERGDTPAGTHRSICVEEIISILNPQPGQWAIDGTLGYGGHSLEILKRITPGGKLLGFDVDPEELPKTAERLRLAGFGPECFEAVRSNFSAMAQVLADRDIPGVDLILADLGVSSMQIDNPDRGFSFKRQGPLDMRMNPAKGESAALLIKRLSEAKIADILRDNGDEPDALVIAHAIAQHRLEMTTTQALSETIKAALKTLKRSDEEITKATRRCFQALRIAVNGEYAALDKLLADLPSCLKPGGRVAILTFHSGEDNRVVRSFEAGLASGLYSKIQDTEIRASHEERYSNPRSKSVRLRWAERS